MAVINQLDPVYVDVSLLAKNLIDLKKNQASGNAENRKFADAIIDNGEEINSIFREPLRCEVMFSKTESDEATGAVVPRLKCKNEEKLLLPGMYVKTRMPMEIFEHAILIPQRSVGRDNRNRSIVYVLKPENSEFYKLEERPVKLLTVHSGNRVIGDGLEAGGLLPVEGLQNARTVALLNGRLKKSQEK